MYNIVFTKQALKDLENLKRIGSAKKAKNIVDVIRQNPYQNPPRYEKLVGSLEGMYSRRINIQYRLVYQVYEDAKRVDNVEYEGTIKIIRMWTGHITMG